MLQLIEKILLDACESHNELAAINAFQKMRKKRGSSDVDVSMDDSTHMFNKMCCYAIHELYYLIRIKTKTGVKVDKHEKGLIELLINLLFVVERGTFLKKYLSIDINNIYDRVARYRKLCKRAAAEDQYVYFEPSWISEFVYNKYIENEERTCKNTQLGLIHTPALGEPHKTTSVSSKYVDGRQLVTIKTVIEHEVSMYIDVNLECPKFIKICMPHLEEPIYISRVIKKYVKFAKIFDGKARENTLSYYYKINKNDGVLEFIDEDTENEVADLLGVGILEKEIIDEDLVMEEAAEKNKLTEEQVAAFKEQLSEVRWSIKNAV
jgi:hypothetical protein